MTQNLIIRTKMKGDETRIISVKFGCNWTCGVRRDIVLRSVDGRTDGQMMDGDSSQKLTLALCTSQKHFVAKYNN